MHFESGNPKSKGIARSRKYVNLEDAVRKIDYFARIGVLSPQTRKAIKNSFDNLRFFTDEDFTTSCCDLEENENG